MNGSPSHHDSQRRLAVIGGGITGLAAAHRLGELDATAQVTLLESASRLGGVLQTQRHNGYLLEHSADSFITESPWALDLCSRIGFLDQLIPTADQWRRAFIVRRGRLHPVPDGFSLLAPSRLWPLLTSPLLGVAGKIRLALEPLIPRRRAGSDESLADFATRRLGRQAYQRLVQPLVAGIYTADAQQLSMAAALPRFLEMERRHGSLFRAARLARAASAPSNDDPASGAADSGARYRLFVAPRDGMESLVHALAGRLAPHTIRLNAQVEQILPAAGGWTVCLAGAGSHHFHGLVVALPAASAARLLQPVHASLAAELNGIPYAGTAVVLAAYDRSSIPHPLDGFGLVVPQIERRSILAVSFASVKFAHRAPQGKVLLRVFLGGASRPELLDLDDDRLERMVAQELADLLGAVGPPEFLRVCRWPRSMPQYHVGHLDRVARIETLVQSLPNLELAGNAYHGVGIGHCINSGQSAAGRLAAGLPQAAALR